MIPTSAMPAGVMKALTQSYENLRKRLDGFGTTKKTVPWTYHDGIPDPRNLPKDSVGVWLACGEVSDSPQDSSFRATYFETDWIISIVVRDGGNDQFGFSPDLGIRAMSDVLRLLTDSFGDSDLDGVVDFTDSIRATHQFGTPSGGDRLVEIWTVRLKAHHQIVSRNP